MPQLDKFPILFQFKSFIIIFLFIYFFFLLVILPLIHFSLRLRKLGILILLLSVLITELEVNRILFFSFFQIKNVFINFLKLNDIFLVLINKQIRSNEYN
jgi:hypothetical protein